MTRYATLAAASLILASSLMPISATAVTTAECLEQSHDPTAVENCQILIDDGKGSAAVYLRLAQALNSVGRRTESYQRIDAGLQAYPRNAELAELKTIVRSNLSEQDYLDAQASKGPSAKATSNAKLRILRINCLKKDGREALDACEEFVSQGGVDAEIDQKRQSLLASLPTPTPAQSTPDSNREAPQRDPPATTAPQAKTKQQPATARVIELTPSTPTPTPSSGNQQSEQASSKAAKDQEAYEQRLALVKKIQATLNDLGYQAGVPDGLPGTKTNRAIQQFYATTRLGPPQDIGQPLLADLERAQQRQQDAQKLLDDSRAALTRGELDSAQTLLGEAQTLASWVTTQDNLAQRIDAALSEQQSAQQNERARQQAVLSIDSLLSTGELDNAERTLDDALSRFSDHPELQALQQRLSAIRDEQAQAKEAQLAQQAREEKIDASLARARSLYQRGEFDAALAELATTSDLSPGRPAIDELRVRIETDRDQQIQAAAERERQQAARERERERASALLDRARTALDSGELDTASALLAEAKTADPTLDTPSFDTQLRNAIDEREQLAREAQQRQLAEQQRQQKITSLEQLASIALDQGDAARATELLEQASAIDPDHTNPELRQRLQQQQSKDRDRAKATALLQQGREALASDDLDRASELARQAQDLDPEFDDSALLIAEITRRQRQIEAETLAARTATNRQTELLATVETLLDNARSELAANNPTAAKALAEEILLLQPDNQEARDIIKGDDRTVNSDQLRLTELLERGEALLDERRRRADDRAKYFNDALPASIGKLFEP